MIYVNDIYRCSQIFNFYLFADDTNLLYSNKDLKDLERVVNEELIKVSDWLDTNCLLTLVNLTFFIFHPYQHKPDCTIQLEIYNNDLKKSVPLEQKTFVKYLGILIDNNLSWKYHIDYISSKVSKGIGIILPVTMLYYHLVSSMMHDINNHRVPSNISMLFTHSEQVHHHSQDSQQLVIFTLKPLELTNYYFLLLE